MKPQVFFISALGCALLLSAIPARSQTTDLEKMLTSSIKERVQMPLLFSTRDTTFALSLPDDEPAEVYLHVTVDRKGRVKEKLTRVNANHFGAYVAPTFADATKELRVPDEAMPALAGKDTSLLLAFPLEYQCVFDTINKAWPDMGERIRQGSRIPMYYYNPRSSSKYDPNYLEGWVSTGVSYAKFLYKNTLPSPVWYYLAFLKE